MTPDEVLRQLDEYDLVLFPSTLPIRDALRESIRQRDEALSDAGDKLLQAINNAARCAQAERRLAERDRQLGIAVKALEHYTRVMHPASSIASDALAVIHGGSDVK